MRHKRANDPANDLGALCFLSRRTAISKGRRACSFAPAPIATETDIARMTDGIRAVLARLT